MDFFVYFDFVNFLAIYFKNCKKTANNHVTNLSKLIWNLNATTSPLSQIQIQTSLNHKFHLKTIFPENFLLPASAIWILNFNLNPLESVILNFLRFIFCIFFFLYFLIFSIFLIFLRFKKARQKDSKKGEIFFCWKCSEF